tara:strand:- start:970 stop:1191 length:222 start_codon:yes stop_codon:yes gene_type:complete
MENKARQKLLNLLNQFMQPIGSLGNNPMCLETAKQCVLIHLNDTLKDEKLRLKPYLFYKEVKKELLLVLKHYK